MIYVTSDQHFGHYGIIQLKERPFKSVDEMNLRMIESWNAVVSNDDVIYVLGDFVGKDPVDKESIVKIGTALNGKKILIKGNHDKSYPMKAIFDEVYSEGRIVKLEYHETKFLMNHYLTNMTVSGNLPSEIYLHAHLHGRIGYNMINTYYRRPYYDVGVDANNFTPVSLDSIIEFFANPPNSAPGIKCPICGSHMNEHQGPYGRFLGCSNYPKCDFTINIDIDRRTAVEKREYREILKNKRDRN